MREQTRAAAPGRTPSPGGLLQRSLVQKRLTASSASRRFTSASVPNAHDRRSPAYSRHTVHLHPNGMR